MCAGGVAGGLGASPRMAHRHHRRAKRAPSVLPCESRKASAPSKLSVTACLGSSSSACQMWAMASRTCTVCGRGRGVRHTRARETCGAAAAGAGALRELARAFCLSSPHVPSLWRQSTLACLGVWVIQVSVEAGRDARNVGPQLAARQLGDRRKPAEGGVGGWGVGRQQRRRLGSAGGQAEAAQWRRQRHGAPAVASQHSTPQRSAAAGRAPKGRAAAAVDGRLVVGQLHEAIDCGRREERMHEAWRAAAVGGAGAGRWLA